MTKKPSEKTIKGFAIAFGVLVIIVSVAVSASSKKEGRQTNYNESPIKEAAVIETDEPKKIDATKVKELLKKVIVKKDEFNGTYWVEPIDKPKYRNRNGIYCYFQKDDSIAQNFHLVVQYAADDWLFIHSYNFSVNGEPARFLIPKDVERDNGEGGIWEWSDISISTTYGDLIESLANAKTAKIRLNGDQYTKDKTITPQQLSSIKTIYALYKAMGGTFE